MSTRTSAGLTTSRSVPTTFADREHEEMEKVLISLSSDIDADCGTIAPILAGTEHFSREDWGKAINDLAISKQIHVESYIAELQELLARVKKENHVTKTEEEMLEETEKVGSHAQKLEAAESMTEQLVIGQEIKWHLDRMRNICPINPNPHPFHALRTGLSQTSAYRAISQVWNKVELGRSMWTIPALLWIVYSVFFQRHHEVQQRRRPRKVRAD